MASISLRRIVGRWRWMGLWLSQFRPGYGLRLSVAASVLSVRNQVYNRGHGEILHKCKAS